jgi:hypothetical protein
MYTQPINTAEVRLSKTGFTAVTEEWHEAGNSRPDLPVPRQFFPASPSWWCWPWVRH